MKGYHKLIRPTNTFGYNEKNSSFFAADSIFNRSLFFSEIQCHDAQNKYIQPAWQEDIFS